MSNESTKEKRGILPAVAATMFGGIVGGFLYIGRGALAVIVWLSMMLALLVIYFAGFPELSVPSFADLTTALLIGASLIAVLILRTCPVTLRWYSNWLIAVVIGLASAIVPAMLVQTFVIQPFYTPASSMEPALKVGDYFFASKWPYGYNWATVPLFPDSFEKTMNAGQPVRGDVVLFKLPRNPRIDYVKRVIGLPGDTVQYSDGILIINGETVPRKPLGAVTVDNGEYEGQLYQETLPGGRLIKIVEIDKKAFADNTRQFEVPEGHYFVLGDNRDNSTDSRFPNVGFVPAGNIFARAERIFWNDDGKPFRHRRFLNQP